MKIYTDNECYETNEELIISHIIEEDEYQHESHEISFTDINGNYCHLFMSQVNKITN